ncbi:putative bifunctional diguanylate cyclase/phosphodiesterase [Cellulomonas endophytica]|uniref:putative bifunctional diguanylate cyclase/phosphodiesterase n=1 Tax=Cellulomonas endophytica TaxID=2494735 RepID=UPI00101094DE|nr:EAL domain-containing protein [Cellulomonas endophytica]
MPRRSLTIPDRVRLLEPVTCAALAAHTVVLQLEVERTWWEALAVGALLAALGVSGVLGRRSVLDSTVRGAVVVVAGTLLLSQRVPGSSSLLLWYFVVASVHPLILPRRIGRVVPVVVPLAYLTLLPQEAADGGVVVALVRAFFLAALGVITGTAAAAYRQAARERGESLALLDTYLDATTVGLGFWDPALRLVRVNRGLADVLGLTLPAALGRRPHDEAALDPVVRASLERVLASGEPLPDVELLANGRVHVAGWFPVRTASRVLGVGAVVVDVTEQRRDAAALAHSATHDALTGLPNRTLFHDRVEVALAQSGRDGRATAVLFCDVDRFKLVNDSLGHAVGDELLRVVADRLQEVVRPGDTVARLGGDEFAVLCPGLSTPDEARALAERVRAAARVDLPGAGGVASASLSVGLALAGPGERDVAGLLRDADVAMYGAKGAGRDRVAVLDPAMRERATTTLTLHADLRRAVREGELALAYQPIHRLDAPGPAPVGWEALARWDRPGHGPVPPSEFVAVAEELRLMDALTDHVLRRALADVRTWRERTGRELTVAVNTSSCQLTSPDGVDRVAAALERAGLPGSALQLEITETVLMEDVAAAVPALQRLRRLGVRMAVDDFGTGYSSLAYLRDLPIDVLKVDRSFTARLPDDESIFSMVVDLAGAIGAATVVEGVETPGQLARVRRLGCPYAQGYLLGRPVPADAVTAALG